MNKDRKKLRIGITIDVFDAVNGGVISTRRISRLLAERGHEVYIFSTGSEVNNPYFIHLKPFYIPFAKTVMKKLKTPLAYPDDKLMRPVFKDLDIVHSMFPFWLGFKSLRLSKEFNIPIVCTFHIQIEHLFKNAGMDFKFLIRNGYRFLVKAFYNRSDFIFCPSAFAQEELRYYGLKTPSQVISNGVASLFVPKATLRPKKLVDKFIILSVGRLTPEKSHSTIIDAIAGSRYKDRIQLMIFGEGPLQEDLQRQATILSNPIHIGLVTQEELVNYFNLADLYVHASEIETEGMAALEASACGLPLLISDSPKSATKQFVLDPSCIFRHKNVPDLTAKIEYWFERPDELKRYGSLYAAAADKYRLSEIVNIIEEKYYEFVEKNSKALARLPFVT